MHIVIKRPLVALKLVNFVSEYAEVKNLFLFISPSDMSENRRQKVQFLWKVTQNKH